MMERQQIKSISHQSGWIRLKVWLSNSWLLLGNVLLLIGGDDSVELCLTAPSLELTQQSSSALSTHLIKDQRV
jgi:hypothetical protein